MATAGEAKTEPEAERMVAGPLREQLDRWLTAGVMNPWCSLCRAPRSSWRYETARTRFTTMAEAAPELKSIEAEMAVTREVFGDIPRSD
jgi:hypothetical protein